MTVRLPAYRPTSRSTQPRAPGSAPAPRRAQATPAPAKDQTLTVELPGIGVKTYTFPTRFRDVDLMSAQFTLPSSAVAKWLPPGLEPASTLGVTRGLVTFQHLGDPAEMSPYSEAQFAVRVKGPGGREAWHVLEMPVDSEENMQRGKIIFGYPKAMSQVELSRREGEARTTDGAPLFSIRMGAALPFAIEREVANESLQLLNGKLVELDSAASGKLRPGLADVTFSPELRRRYPGLPASGCCSRSTPRGGCARWSARWESWWAGSPRAISRRISACGARRCRGCGDGRGAAERPRSCALAK